MKKGMESKPGYAIFHRSGGIFRLRKGYPLNPEEDLPLNV